MKILVVEDHAMVREGLVRIIGEALPEAEVLAVGTATEARSHLDWAERVLLDLSLPDQHGLKFLEEVGQSHPDLPVVILTAYDEPAFRTRAAELGAAAFLSKNEAPEILAAALADLSSPPDAGTHPRLERLSPTERQVLALFGQGLSNAEVARQLGIEEKTVYTHRRHLMFKLGLRSAQDLLRFATLYHADLD
ncbi:MAG TPA: response regulator transcription factor [Oceanithermus profundus]|uniref:Response regulator transcription factor n=1 Tax=Oceanithermus profundus TaxID=187137 RepID=A0A7C4Z5E1_9DEIN|nr:response regulator transcription factor [Oceanithermus profundus]